MCLLGLRRLVNIFLFLIKVPGMARPLHPVTAGMSFSTPANPNRRTDGDNGWIKSFTLNL